MATFTLTIDADNAAFEERERGEEIAYILRETAVRIANDTESIGYSFAIQDSNGNNVGRAEMMPDRLDEEDEATTS